MASVQLPGALVLVTGAGSGIGRATALDFARAGGRVLAVDIDGEAAEKTAAACTEAGAPAVAAYTCDVSDADAVNALAERVHAEHGVLDVLVNNAGVGMSGPFADMTIDDWRWIRSVNLDGVVHGCHAFGPGMLERGSGQVVNVASALGYTPRATESAYVTTKAAVIALSQCLRAEWGRRGVGVSVVCPGVTNTPIVTTTRFVGANGAPQSATKVFARGHTPESVAAAIVAAVHRNRAVVPVGIESRAGWWLHRLAPQRVQQVVARYELR
jgi:NAD(P)-dependent dehydrogenase (short-subunit alcohol dehydrogenase family)